MQNAYLNEYGINLHVILTFKMHYVYTDYTPTPHVTIISDILYCSVHSVDKIIIFGCIDPNMHKKISKSIIQINKINLWLIIISQKNWD